MGLTILWATLTGGAILTMALMGSRMDFAVLLPAVAAALSAVGSLAYEAGRGSRRAERVCEAPTFRRN